LKYFYIIATLAVVIFFGFVGLNSNEKWLNFFAQYYFDKNYYLAHYPEVKKQNIDPFEHYVKYGWKEGKNPNETFDTNFYTKIYLYKNNFHLNPLADYVKAKLFFAADRATNVNQLAKVELLPNPKYYISLVAVFQNEARFLKEWLEFYLLMGVEHFYLYNHLSNDNYMEILEPYIKRGLVDLKDVKGNPRNIDEWNEIQANLYTETANEVKDITEWLIVVDTDEFLFPVKENNLQEVLKKYDDYASISVNWRLFGSSDIEKIAPDKLMIESLTKSSVQQERLLKNIVKPRYVYKFENPHFAWLLPRYVQTTENFEHFKGALVPVESKNILRINHYWARDEEFFKSHKLARVHLVESYLTDDEKKAKIDKWIDANKVASEKYDDSILRFVKVMRERMGFQ
jgi:hypothetical protein